MCCFSLTDALHQVYEAHVQNVFDGLDRVESILSDGRQYLVPGAGLSEADIRIYPTLIRFDAAYYVLFKVSPKRQTSRCWQLCAEKKSVTVQHTLDSRWLPSHPPLPPQPLLELSCLFGLDQL